MTDSNMPLYLISFAVAFILTVVLERVLIPRLSSYAKQPIYLEGPYWHGSKSGTPTMGGLGFVSAATVALAIGGASFIISGSTATGLSLMTLCIYALLSALIGFIDDMTKLKRHENGGLTPRAKIILQSLAAGIFLFLRYFLLNESTAIHFSFGSFDIGPLYYLLAFVMLIATSNCANLTDGIDGLASGVAFAIGIGLFYVSFAASPDTAVLASTQLGISLAFLIFNLNPARIFMGDTGSLFFGATLGGAAIALGNPLIVLCLGSVYLVEGVSVILQVISYKLFGKRIFKMAPIHHHFERLGFSENKIVISFMLLTLLTSLLSIFLFV